MSFSTKASVTEEGAILLGEQVACDAFDFARPLRIVTHAHQDHLYGLKNSLQKCDSVIMTSATRDLLGVLYSKHFLAKGKIRTSEYRESISFDGERITLYPSNHVLGSAQVLVEDDEGQRFVYTSDFRLSPDTPIIESDVLVIDATYGNPFQTRPFEKVVTEALVSLVESDLQTSPVYIFCYHGKIQEVMKILHDGGIRVPFIVPEKIFEFTKVCEKHGLKLGDYLQATDEEARTILEKREPCIAFYHMNSRRYVGKDALRINVTGWEFSSPRRQISENEHIIALSDHADFKGLLQYVGESKPKLVITDHYRFGDAEVLARQIEKRLGIPAKALPKTNQNREAI